MWDDSYDSLSPPKTRPTSSSNTAANSNKYDFPSSPVESIHNKNKRGKNNNNNNGAGKGKKKSEAFDADLLFSPSSASESGSPIGSADKPKRRDYNNIYTFDEPPKQDYLSNFMANSGDLEDSILGELLGGPKKTSNVTKIDPIKTDTTANNPPGKSTASASLPSTTSNHNTNTSSSSNTTRFSPNKLEPLDSSFEKTKPAPSRALTTSPVVTSRHRIEKDQPTTFSRDNSNNSNNNTISSMTSLPSGRNNAKKYDFLSSSPSPSPPKKSTFEFNDNPVPSGTRGHFNSFDLVDENESSTEFLPTKPSSSTLPSHKLDSNVGPRRNTNSKNESNIPSKSSTTSLPPSLSSKSNDREDFNEGIAKRDDPDTDNVGGGDSGKSNAGFVPSFLDPGRQGRRRRNLDGPTTMSLDAGIASKGGGLSKLDDLDAALGLANGPATAPKKALVDPFAKVETKIPILTKSNSTSTNKPVLISDSDDSSDDLKPKSRYDRKDTFGSFLKQNSASSTTAAPAPTSANDSTTASSNTAGPISAFSRPNSAAVPEPTPAANDTQSNKAQKDSKASNALSSSVGSLPALSMKSPTPSLKVKTNSSFDDLDEYDGDANKKYEFSSEDELDVSGIVKREPHEHAPPTKQTNNNSNKDDNKKKEKSPEKNDLKSASSDGKKDTGTPTGIQLSRKTVGSANSRSPSASPLHSSSNAATNNFATTKPSTTTTTANNNKYKFDESLDSSTDQLDLPGSSYLPSSIARTSSSTQNNAAKDKLTITTTAPTSTTTTFTNSAPASTVTRASALASKKFDSDEDSDHQPAESVKKAHTATAQAQPTRSSSSSNNKYNFQDDDEDEIEDIGDSNIQKEKVSEKPAAVKPAMITRESVLASMNKDKGQTSAMPSSTTSTATTIGKVRKSDEEEMREVLAHSKAEKEKQESVLQDEISRLKDKLNSYESSVFVNAASLGSQGRAASEELQLKVLYEQNNRYLQEQLDYKRIISTLEIEINRLKDESNIQAHKHLEEIKSLKTKHEQETTETKWKVETDREEIERRHQESISAMKALHQEEILMWKERVKQIEALDGLQRTLQQTSGSMKFLEQSLSQRHRQVELMKEGQLQARESLLTDMESKAKDRMEAAEVEGMRLKGILSHMEHVVSTLRQESAEEKTRLLTEHQRLTALQKSLEEDKKGWLQRISQERSDLQQRQQEHERQQQQWHQDKIIFLEDMAQQKRQLEKEKQSMEQEQQRQKRQLEHHTLQLQDEEKRMIRLREELHHDKLLFEDYKKRCSNELEEAAEVQSMLQQAMQSLQQEKQEIQQQHQALQQQKSILQQEKHELQVQQQMQEEQEIALREGFAEMKMMASQLSSQESNVQLTMQQLELRKQDLQINERNIAHRKLQQAAMFREQLAQHHGTSPMHEMMVLQHGGPSPKQNSLPPPPPQPEELLPDVILPNTELYYFNNSAAPVQKLSQVQGKAAPPHSPIAQPFASPNPHVSSANKATPSTMTSHLRHSYIDENRPNHHLSSPVYPPEHTTAKNWSEKFQHSLRQAYSGTSTGMFSPYSRAERELPKEVRTAQRVLRESKHNLERVTHSSMETRRILEQDDPFVHTLKLRRKEEH